MNTKSIITQYLDRYVLPDSRVAARFVTSQIKAPFERVLCIPIFDERSHFLQALRDHPGIRGTLIILIINAPIGADSEAHQRTLDLLTQLRNTSTCSSEDGHAFLVDSGVPDAFCSVLVMDHCSANRVLPTNEGVGLARKLGNDVALELWRDGHVKSPWFYQTDGDSTLPNNYFVTPPEADDAVALHLDFEHVKTDGTSLAQKLYDLKLDYYVAGLTYAGSPYSHYSLGSAMIVHAKAYAVVRGYPKRSAGEDFYILNKLAKFGAIAFDRSRTIKLQERLSTRVPFGTGPGVARFGAAQKPLEATEFYAPACFDALKKWLILLDVSAANEAGNPHFKAQHNFNRMMKLYPLKDVLLKAVKQLNLLDWLEKTVRNNANPDQAKRQLNFGMDGLKTLQLVHALRDHGLANITGQEAQDWMFGLPPTVVNAKTRLGSNSYRRVVLGPA